LRPQLKRDPLDGAALQKAPTVMKPLAEATFRASSSSHRSGTIHIRLDAPRRVATGEWTCSVVATGLVKRTAVRGEDALQALCLALDFLGTRLYEARRRGVQLAFRTGEAVPLFAYFHLREWRHRLSAKQRRLTSA